MFLHNFKYTFKILLKNKSLVFWSILWPIILVTLFKMTFSNMVNSEKLDIIPIGVVDDASYTQNEYLAKTLSELSNSSSDNYMFDIIYSSKDELDKLLNDKKIDGYIDCNDEVNIVVKENGINQTIIKYVVDEVKQYQILIEIIVNQKVEKDIQNGMIPNTDEIIENIKENFNFDKQYLNDNSNKNINYMMIEYYTVLAMACLYSSLLSIETVKNFLANTSKKGSRISISPAKKMVCILSGLASSFVIQMISISVLLLYMIYILKVDFGSNYFLVILLTLIGSIAGLSMGTLVGSISFKNDNIRIGIMNIIVMVGCFFSGMMGVTEKYVIDTKVPLINKLNPSNMITDGFYSLYYYENLDRFYFNILCLLILSIICIFSSYFLIRRKKYDSI